MKNKLIFLLLFFVTACQTPTEIKEKDTDLEGRVFSKIEHGKKVELKRSIIVDVRSRFKHEMSRLPRSFFASGKDWDLTGYTGPRLEKKKEELQRILSLNGVDPLTQVVILGNGLKGKGEEFLLSSTLINLGVERISFMSEEQATKAMVSRNLPKVENAPKWSKPLKFNFDCKLSGANDEKTLIKKSDIIISKKSAGKGGTVKEFFASDLTLKKKVFPKGMRLRVYSPGSYWAYGVALFLKGQGRMPCVL